MNSGESSAAVVPGAVLDRAHTRLGADVALQLGSNPGTGLTPEEAVRRLAEAGPNELPAAARSGAWIILLGQFKNVLILILLIATALSLGLGHGIEAAAIAAIAVFTVVLGFIQEYRAEHALEALRRLAAPMATVLRYGREQRLPARNLVPGDVIVLGAGDRVPADARLLEAVNLRIDEASLTGESSPVSKHSEALPATSVALGDRRNMVYSSTAVTYGRGRGIVVATGHNTEVGKIGSLLEGVRAGKTPLEQQMNRVGRLLACAALGVVALVFVLGVLRGQPLLEMVLFGIALAVAVVPEALPAVVTISLAIGARRMVRRNALVRRLPIVETLGSTTTICADKTGTLTSGEMMARELFVGGKAVHVSGAGYEPEGSFLQEGTTVKPDEPLLALLRAAALCSDAALVRDQDSGRWEIHGDPTEGALVVLAAKAGLEKSQLEAESPRVGEIPFSSERKRMTTLHAGAEGAFACSKGAPETVLETCTLRHASHGDEPLTDEGRETTLAAAREMATRAMRVLAVAMRREAEPEHAESGMTFLGLVGMLDPPRHEARAAVKTCFQAGIRPVMITGDHPATARTIASELGILGQGQVATGLDLDSMDDHQLEQAVEGIEVCARVSPAHKLRVVAALQARGHIVAMTGDGVNDAPALKKADIGIAMGITGTDVAKEAAGMILTDDNFASIVSAVEEGRAIFDNIKKYLMYLFSSNIGEIVLIAAAMILGFPIPLAAVQILYVNLATDGLPALALAVDPHEADLMHRAPRRTARGILSRPIVLLMVLGGLWSGWVNLGVFVWALDSGREIREAMSMTFASLVLIQFFKAYSFRSERCSILQRPFTNRWLNLAILWEVVLLACILYVPFLQEPFRTVPLSGVDWLIVLPSALTILPVLELVKWMERKGWLGRID